MSDSALNSRSPFDGLKFGIAGDARPGVIAQVRDGLGFAVIIVRRQQRAALKLRLLDHYGINLPEGSARVTAQETSLICLGPETWLACQERGGNHFASSLRAQLGSLASVSDQSDGYAVLRLWGPQVREALAKLIPLDLHPRTFKVDDAASTVASHIGVTLWRLEDTPEGASVFELAVSRSLASSFQQALAESGAKPGLGVIT